FDKRLEAQIAARRNEILFTGGEALIVLIPGLLVVAGFTKRSANRLFDAHARGRIPPGLTRDTEVRTLGIFSECELDAGKSSFERKLRSRLAPAKLHDQRLSADGIGGTVKNVRGRDSARHITIDVDILWIQDLRHIHDRGNVNAALADAHRCDV